MNPYEEEPEVTVVLGFILAIIMVIIIAVSGIYPRSYLPGADAVAITIVACAVGLTLSTALVYVWLVIRKDHS